MTDHIKEYWAQIIAAHYPPDLGARYMREVIYGGRDDGPAGARTNRALWRSGLQDEVSGL